MLKKSVAEEIRGFVAIIFIIGGILIGSVLAEKFNFFRTENKFFQLPFTLKKFSSSKWL